jgi:hypothetical protein
MMGMFLTIFIFSIARTMMLCQWLQCIGFIDVSENALFAFFSSTLNWMKGMPVHCPTHNN